MSTIVLISKGFLDYGPTQLNHARLLKSHFDRVICLCGDCRDVTREALGSDGIEVEILSPGSAEPRSAIGKVFSYTLFRKRAWAFLDRFGKDVPLWISRVDTARALGKRLVTHRYALAAYELHDHHPAFQRFLQFYSKHASCVVAMEKCRASIMRVWFRLEKSPFVLPNYPMGHPRKRNLPIESHETAQLIEFIPTTKKIALYQGWINSDRSLLPIARAFSKLVNSYQLVLLGKDINGFLGEVKSACPSLIHIPWLVPPSHLQVTSHAHIGIAAYAYDSLNSIFCAPNKIWEYTGFSIPLLCQDLPGLAYTVGVAGAAMCVDLEDEDAVLSAVQEIDSDYLGMAEKARGFYEAYDPYLTMMEIVDELIV